MYIKVEKEYFEDGRLVITYRDNNGKPRLEDVLEWGFDPDGVGFIVEEVATLTVEELQKLLKEPEPEPEGIAAIPSQWPRIWEQIKQEKMYLRTYLKKDHPMLIKGQQLVLLFESQFYCEGVYKNRILIEHLIEQVVGQRVTVVCRSEIEGKFEYIPPSLQEEIKILGELMENIVVKNAESAQAVCDAIDAIALLDGKRCI